MTSSPPVKKLRQTTIFEITKKQRSLVEKDQRNKTACDIPKEESMSDVCNRPDSQHVSVGTADRNRVTCAAKERLQQNMEAGKVLPGSSIDAKPAVEASHSQDSVTSGTDAEANNSPVLFSSTDSEDGAGAKQGGDRLAKVKSLGTPISELNTYPSCLPAMGSLSPSHDHTVLIRTPYRAGQPPIPYPAVFKDKWDANHVKLPCSSESLYPVEGQSGSKSLNSRWELIQQALLSNMASSFDIEEAILTYNTRYSQRWNFQDLHSFFTEVLEQDEAKAFFKDILPRIVELALQLPHLCTQAIPMLKKHMDHSITMSQQQVACLLANAFFCTFPRRNTTKKQCEYSSYPDINFSRLFQNSNNSRSHRKHEKLKCIMNYFKRVTTEMPTGTITFKRQYLTDLPDWQRASANLSRLHVTCSGTIEDEGQGMLQVDFANKYLGGGVLGYGSVQEEIRFLICPELIASRLFTEELDHNECLIITGCERFSDYTGYAESFQWAGNHLDKTQRDPWGRICTQIVAIDALVIRSYRDQFHENLIRRELNKAYCGFFMPDVRPEHLSAIATGNWGCGAFGGDLQLKALLQLLAASVTHRDLCYFTFGDAALMESLYKLHQFAHDRSLTVSDMYSLILQYYSSMCQHSSQSRKSSSNLYEYIYNVYTDNETESDSIESISTPTTTERNESSQEAQCDWTHRDSPDYAASTP